MSEKIKPCSKCGNTVDMKHIGRTLIPEMMHQYEFKCTAENHYYKYIFWAKNNTEAIKEFNEWNKEED